MRALQSASGGCGSSTAPPIRTQFTLDKWKRASSQWDSVDINTLMSVPAIGTYTVAIDVTASDGVLYMDGQDHMLIEDLGRDRGQVP